VNEETREPGATPTQVPPAPAEPGPQRISITKFFETELRVAEILSAERVTGADKLLKLEIDLGNEKRQLVAGIALSYAPETLIGRRIIVVANLEPARIRGVESQGMLLAADLDGKPVIATFDAPVPPGTTVR